MDRRVNTTPGSPIFAVLPDKELSEINAGFAECR
jgi:hypothetical protein